MVSIQNLVIIALISEICNWF